MYDIAIIGAGITGSFLAHDLSGYQLKIAVIEKCSDVANGATMANSAIIHSGHDPKKGTLKAKLNVRGNRMYEKVCVDLGVHFKRTSAFVVATSQEENETLEQLYNQATSREIPAFLLTRQEALAKEPNLSDEVIRVMELPTTGIIYPWEVAIALMEEAVENGTTLFLNREVSGIKKVENYFSIETIYHGGPLSKTEKERSENSINQNCTCEEEKLLIQAKYVINAAGVHGDDIYRLISNIPGQFTITPRRGEYFVLDKQKTPLVNRVIYPVPSSVGKGVLVVPTTHENILLGPNSQFIEDKEGNATTKDALDYVKKAVLKTVKNIPFDQVIRSFSGLRPTGDKEDFVIEEASDVPHFINVTCIESPGLASAPAISEYVIDTILKKTPLEGLAFIKKENYKKRRPSVNLKNMNQEMREKLVLEDSSFGKVICRCEQITEGEIIDAIRRPVGATTVKGIKKRVRPGMGRCQGGFCEPKVVDILARELGISPFDVRMDTWESSMLLTETKGGSSS